MTLRERLKRHRYNPEKELYGFCHAYIDEANERAGKNGGWKSTKSEALLAAFTEEELEELYARWQIEKE